MKLLFERIFKKWLAPLVNLENTLLLFATFIFHRHYFGAGHPTADLFALDEIIPTVIYIYGAIVLLASLFKIPPDWKTLVAFMVFIGNVMISVAYTSLFWMRLAAPSWQELLVECYYLLLAVIAFIQMILLLTQPEEKRLAVSPRLGVVPGPFKSLAILAYVAGATLILERGLSIAPEAVTSQVNLYGAALLEVLARVFPGEG